MSQTVEVRQHQRAKPLAARKASVHLQLVKDLRAEREARRGAVWREMEAEICYQLYRDLFPDGQW